MAKLNIVKDGDPVLRKVCRPVETVTPRIRTLLDDMIETMRAANGCGLAAPQVGVLRRVVVVECEEGKVIELINPRIIARAGKQEEAEGCLSVPGRWGITDRPRHVTVRAMDRYGNEFEVSGSDLLARAFCHELDHLDGVLFTDKVIRMLEPDEVE
jgi:peptide deformylase